MTGATPVAPAGPESIGPESPTAPGRAALPARPGARWRLPLLLSGWVLLLVWAGWWLACFRSSGRLEHWNHTRVPAWEFLGFDFLHNFGAVRMWITTGGNPYRQDFGDWRGLYGYPPVVLALFSWTALFGQGAAVALWTAFIAGAVALAGWFVAGCRVALGASRVPLPFILGTTLCSLPVLFAMERGQCDAIILVMILAAAAALQRRPSWGRDLVIGVCLALAAWVKIYPGLLILGLLAIGAWRASGMAVLAAALMGLVPLRATQDWIAAAAVSQQDRVGFVSEILDWLRNPQHTPAQLNGWYPAIGVDSHSLATYWSTFWGRTGSHWLANMPGVLGAGLVLFSLALWVSARLLRSPARTQLALPYLLWLAALGTFWMPVSYDYNLLYLPLAALAVCDRRDPLRVRLALLATVVWWQPFQLGAAIGPDTFMFLKLFSLLGVGISIVRRAREGTLAAARSPAARDEAGARAVAPLATP